MEESIALAKKLTGEWKDLSFEVQKTKKIKFEIFNSLFSQTYSLLCDHITESSLDKSCIELVAEAFLFANIKDDSLDSISLAALVLTERMLNYCAFNTAASPSEPFSIYVVEARKSVVLDFNDVNESVSKLEKVFNDIYWLNINT